MKEHPCVDANGPPEGTVYYDSLGHRRVVTPTTTIADDGTVTHGYEADAVFAAHCDDVQARRRAALRKMSPTMRRSYVTYLRTGRIPTTPTTPTTARPRGAGRPRTRTSSARRSSERSGDSGDDSDPSEPPERLCACGCREDISHLAPQARYLNGTHGNRARQRRKRQLARGWNPAVPSRDGFLGDPYSRFDGKVSYEMLRRRVEQGCRCNGSFLPDETGVHCIWCGHDRDGGDPGAREFISARSAETRRVRRAVV